MVAQKNTQANETTLTGQAKRVKDDQKEAIQEKNHENAILQTREKFQGGNGQQDQMSKRNQIKALKSIH